MSFIRFILAHSDVLTLKSIIIADRQNSTSGSCCVTETSPSSEIVIDYGNLNFRINHVSPELIEKN